MHLDGSGGVQDSIVEQAKESDQGVPPKKRLVYARLRGFPCGSPWCSLLSPRCLSSEMGQGDCLCRYETIHILALTATTGANSFVARSLPSTTILSLVLGVALETRLVDLGGIPSTVCVVTVFVGPDMEIVPTIRTTTWTYVATATTTETLWANN